MYILYSPKKQNNIHIIIMSGNNLTKADSSAFWGNMLFAYLLYYFSYKYIKIITNKCLLGLPFL